jgi:benzoate/toluate 1,2-dioxygenase reductase component
MRSGAAGADGSGARREAVVTARRWLSPHAFELELTRPPGFAFTAGQHIRLRLGASERDYSLVTAPAQTVLAVCVRHLPGAGLAAALAQLEPGEPLSFTGPRGHFVLRPSARPVVLVATGTGIAPFVAMVRDGLRGFTLLQGAREAGEFYYSGELAVAARTYVGCLTRPGLATPSGDLGVFPGRVTELLRTRLAPGVYDFYLCGGGEMIRDVTLIIDERFAGSLVFSESFY